MFVVFIFFWYIFNINAKTIVSTSRGYIEGYHVDYGNDHEKLYYGQADVFLGIPYATPPIEQLRFQKTEIINRLPNFYTSSNPWNATFYRPACPQFYATNDQMSEDCLYLNIITPNANSNNKYPVMVWIHGGGFFTGSMRSDVSEYYSIMGAVRNLVSRGVVIVNIQYRLGLLGFFTTYTDDFPPNLGLTDQVLALKFIKEEISNFGGNPDKITLFGNSAGSCSISAHSYSPLSQGLFHQAILESGTIWTCFDNVIGSETASSISFKRAQTLCNFTKEMWDSKDFSTLKTCLLQADFRDFLNFDRWDNSLGWKITVDGYFLLDAPENLWKSRPNIPIILGTSKDEWTAWLYGFEQNLSSFEPNMLLTSLKKYNPKLLEKRGDINEVFREIFSTNVKDDDNLGWLKVLSQIFSGAFFTGFTGREADYYFSNKNPNVYLYEFTYPSRMARPLNISGWWPVLHSTDEYYVWMPEKLWNPSIQSRYEKSKILKIFPKFLFYNVSTNLIEKFFSL